MLSMMQQTGSNISTSALVDSNKQISSLKKKKKKK